MKTISFLSTSDRRSIIIIRIMVGVVFLLEGLQKFLYPDQLGVGRFIKIGLPAPELLAPLVATVEITAGLLVIVGFITRAAALALFTIITVAIITTKIPILLGHGYWGFSLKDLPRYGFLSMAHEMRTDWSMLMGSLFLIITGAGRWSADHKITR